MLFPLKSAHIELFVKNGCAIVTITQFKKGTIMSFLAEDFLDLLNDGMAFMKTSEGSYIKMIFNPDVGHIRTDKCNTINTFMPEKAMQKKFKNELITLIDATYQKDGGWMS